MNYLNSLNEKQKEAVLHIDGPLLIVGGAGAGKTKTITHRIIHLIHSGVSPSNILAVTFTNKAAKEMRERVLEMLKDRSHGIDIQNQKESLPFISTFHSLGVHIIKENSHLIGLNKYFSIMDENDSLSLIKNIMKEKDIDTKEQEPRKIKSVISKSKGDFITVQDYENNSNSHLQSLIAMIWKEYEKRMRQEKSLDFDDLLLKSVLILKEYPEVKKSYQEKWKYVHIDEYQDTNQVQYEMTKLLVGKNKNICVVGDTDQNIYSWRGANIKNMLVFEKDYPEAKMILLEQNYRSTKNILEVANSIIQKNEYRIPKNLFTENKNGEEINICEAYDEICEAEYVTQKIDNLLQENTDPKEIAVLYRANFQSRVLEEIFISKNIPYVLLGVKFFDRKEIKDVLAYLRASFNRDNLSDIKRIINFPARGIGKVTLLKLFSNKLEELPEKTQIKIKNFYLLLDKIKDFAENNSVSETIKFIIEESKIKEELKNGSSDDLERLENIMELVSLSLKYDNMEDGLMKLLEDASLSSDQDTLIHKESGGVKLMTVHASKGLEFKYVFITGLEQDLFPHNKDNSKSKEDKEEERRLFYVAVTRARHKLFISYSSIRTIFGMKQVNTPSEFLYDIPNHLSIFEQHYSKSNNNEKIVYL